MQHGDTLTAWNAQHAICYTYAHCVPMVVVTLAYRGHVATTKFEYSCSPGFRTTRVMTPFQTLPLCEGAGVARLALMVVFKLALT